MKPWNKSYDPQVPQNLIYPNVPLYQLFDEAAQKSPHQTCITFRDQKITYQVMRGYVDALANGLLSLGVQKGERVGLIFTNTPQFVMGFYAILKAGGVVVACNPFYKEREFTYQLQNSGCKYLIATSDVQGMIKSIQPQTSIESVIFSDPQDLISFEGVSSDFTKQSNMKTMPGDFSMLEIIKQNYGTPFEDIGIGLDDEAIFQYSGGTTGIPKAAIGLHRNLVANTLQFKAWLHSVEQGNEVVLAAIPLYHVYGMVIAMSMGIALGANLVLIPNARDVGDILRNIEQYKATLFPGVPNMYQAINCNPDVLAGRYNLRTIKACICGSSPLLPEIKTKFEELTGGKLLEGYGLSEAPTATHCNPLFGENRVGSIGLPLPDVDCRIISLEDGKTEMGINEPGELVIKSPQVMKEYHEMPDETAITLVDGWLHTGDIARMDEDGYFYLIDRKKDVIKPSGFQVWPREVEEVLAEHPAVLEAAVAGVIRPDCGEIVRAWVVLKPGKALTAKEITDWCRAKLANYKSPSEVEFISLLPRTPVGKVLRRELVRIYNEKHS